MTDESLFSPNSYDKSRHWAPKGQPLRRLRKFAPERPCMVLGVIGPTVGNLYYHVDTRSFNAEDMKLILKEIRRRVGPQMKLALVLDNASFHRSKTVKELAESPEVDIRLIFNAVGRPDLATVGIENIWAICKRLYRASVDKLKAANVPYDNQGLVQDILSQLDDDCARRLASKAIPAVRAGKPIMPLPNERGVNNRYSTLLYSP